MNILIDELHAEVTTDINPENAFVGLRLPTVDSNIDKKDMISMCLSGFAKHMKEFSKQYPKFVSITIA